MKNDSDQGTRLARLEIAMTHFQRDYDTLNQVVTESANQIEALKRAVARLTKRLDGIEARVPDTTSRTPEEERPPHY